MQMGELAVRMAETERLRSALDRQRADLERQWADSEARCCAAERASAEADRRAAAAQDAVLVERRAAAAAVEAARMEAAAHAEEESTMVQETLAESTAALSSALQQVTHLKARVTDLEARLTAAQRERDAALQREAARNRTAAASQPQPQREALAAVPAAVQTGVGVAARPAAGAAPEASSRSGGSRSGDESPVTPRSIPLSMAAPAGDQESSMVALSSQLRAARLPPGYGAGPLTAVRSPSRAEELAVEAMRVETEGRLEDAGRRIAKLEARLTAAGMPPADSPEVAAVERRDRRTRARRLHEPEAGCAPDCRVQ